MTAGGKKTRWPFLALALGMFAMGCDDYLFAGLLTAISGALGVSPAAAAQGTSAFGVSFVAALPFCVFLLARRPAREALLFSLLVFATGNVLTLLSASLPAFIAGRAIVGFGTGLFLPIASSAAVQLVASDSRGTALSLVWGAYSAGAVAGVPSGLWLADAFGWRMSVSLVLVLSLLSLSGLLAQKLRLSVEAPPGLREQARLLLDRQVMSVVGVSFLTATASLGLYAYATELLAGTAVSVSGAFSLWNLGGLLGSLAVGPLIDRTGKPQALMAAILAALVAVFLLLPVAVSGALAGLLPFFVWGVLGWGTGTPQQCSLIQLQPGHDATLVALNSSAVSLGCVAGSSLGGLALAAGMSANGLACAAAALSAIALLWQLSLIRLNRSPCR